MFPVKIIFNNKNQQCRTWSIFLFVLRWRLKIEHLLGETVKEWSSSRPHRQLICLLCPLPGDQSELRRHYDITDTVDSTSSNEMTGVTEDSWNIFNISVCISELF